MQPSSSAFDALDAYLAAPTIPSVQDPLGYWQALSSNGDPLAQMSLDYLSSPGKPFCLLGSVSRKQLISGEAASTDVERGFSRGRLNVSRLRHSLSDQSTRAATVLGSWAGIPGLVVDDELVSNICDKEFRWQTTIVEDDIVMVD